MKARAAAFAGLLFYAGFSVSAFAYIEGTHEILSERALDISEASEGGRIYTLLPDTFSYEQARLRLRLGAHAEDDFPRSLHHFFNPITGQGISPCAICVSSPDWIIDGIGQLPESLHSYGTAIANYYLALIAESKDARRAAARDLFFDLGHVIHHIQDMAQPQHTRNDVHCDVSYCAGLSAIWPPAYKPSGYERFVLRATPGNLGLDGVSLTAVYSAGDRDPAFTTARDFWKTPAPAAKRGLAEISNASFVTIGTNFYPCSENSQGFCNRPDLPNPAATQLTSQSTNWLTSTKKSYYYLGRKIAVSRLGEFTVDGDVYEAQKNFLLPKAVEYGAGLINFFFRGNISATTDSAGHVVIVNNGPALPIGDVEFHFDDIVGNRQNSFWTWSGPLLPGANSTHQLVPRGSPSGNYVMVFKSATGSAGSWVVAANTATLTGPPDPSGTYELVTYRGIPMGGVCGLQEGCGSGFTLHSGRAQLSSTRWTIQINAEDRNRPEGFVTIFSNSADLTLVGKSSVPVNAPAAAECVGAPHNVPGWGYCSQLPPGWIYATFGTSYFSFPDDTTGFTSGVGGQTVWRKVK